MKPHIKTFITEFLAEMIEGNAAIFAGAGLSVPAGYVDWRALLRPLSIELDLNIDLESDLVAVAQFHVNASGQNRHKLHKALIEALSPDNAPTANHRLLAQLPMGTYWTTNYDKLLEKHFATRTRLSMSKMPCHSWRRLVPVATRRFSKCMATWTDRTRQ